MGIVTKQLIAKVELNQAPCIIFTSSPNAIDWELFELLVVLLSLARVKKYL